MILRITVVEITGPMLLSLEFNDGTQKTVGVAPLLDRVVFEPLRDSAFFVQAKLDPISGTVVWPNGADFAPEALHELAEVEHPASTR